MYDSRYSRAQEALKDILCTTVDISRIYYDPEALRDFKDILCCFVI